MHDAVVNVCNDEVPAISRDREHVKQSGSKSYSPTDDQCQPSKTAARKSSFETVFAQTKIEKPKARKPKDVPHKRVVDESIGGDEVDRLKECASEIGQTEEPCQYAKHIQGQRVLRLDQPPDGLID